MIKWLNVKSINWKRVKEILSISSSMNWYTNFGPVSGILEKDIHQRFNIKDDKAVIVVSNGSHALHAIVAAIEIKNGPKEYAVPAFTFPSNVQGNLRTASVIDVNDDFGLDLNEVSTEDGIIVTNIFGYSQDIDSYTKWAKDNDKILIFDNAATSLTTYKGSNCLNYGVASFISFHHTKPLGFGEGGAIIIDKEYEPYVRQAINFGFDENRECDTSGNNWKMSDIAASFILQHLGSHDEIFNEHNSLYSTFHKEIESIDGVSLFPNHSDVDKTFPSGLAVVFDKPVSIETAKALCDDEIDIKKYYNPLANEIYCPNSHLLYSKIIIYPCHVDMSETDIHNIVKNIKQICNA